MLELSTRAVAVQHHDDKSRLQGPEVSPTGSLPTRLQEFMRLALPRVTAAAAAADIVVVVIEQFLPK